jgi:hypothetical protein
MLRAMQKRLTLAALLTLMPALAQAAPKSTGSGAATGEVRRDPQGIRGISPYMEQISKGRLAFEKKNVEGALKAYRGAVRSDGDRILGHVLIAQIQLSKGDLDAALETLGRADGKKGSDEEISKLYAFRAELEERKRNSPPGKENAPGVSLDPLVAKWKVVSDAWDGLVKFIGDKSELVVRKETGTDRGSKVQARVKRERDYQPVRKRIADEEAERAKAGPPPG